MKENKIHAELNKDTLEFFGERMNQVEAIGSSLINRHLNILMEKFEADSSQYIPQSLISSVRHFVKINIKPLSICFCNSIPKETIVDHAFHDEKNKLNFVFTVLPWETNEAVIRLAENSTKKPYGYINRLIKIYDSWPSKNTKYLFHMIICFNARTDIFKMHCCITDKQGESSTEEGIQSLPIELLNDEELEQSNFFNIL